MREARWRVDRRENFTILHGSIQGFRRPRRGRTGPFWHPRSLRSRCQKQRRLRALRGPRGAGRGGGPPACGPRLREGASSRASAPTRASTRTSAATRQPVGPVPRRGAGPTRPPRPRRPRSPSRRSAGRFAGPRHSRAARIFLSSQGIPGAPGGHGRPGAPVDTSTDDRRPAPARDRRGCFRQGPPVYATPAPGSTGLRNTRRLILEGLPSQIRSRFEGGSELVSQGLI